MFCEGSIASAERMCFCDSCWLVWHLSHGTAREVEQPIVFEDEPLAIVSPECVAVGFVQAAGGFFEAGGEETPLGSADIFGEPFAELAPSDRVSLGPRPLYVGRSLREAGSCDLGVLVDEADRVVEGLCRPCLESDPVSQRSECSRCEPCGGGNVVSAEGGNGSDALSMASAVADFNKFGQELADAKVNSMDAPTAAGAALSEQSEAAAGATADTDGGFCPTVGAKGRRSRKRKGQRQPSECEALGASACEECEHGACFTCELKVFLESIRAQAYAIAHMANKPRQRVRSVLLGQCEKAAGWVARMRAQQGEQFDMAACEALLAEIEWCLMG